MTVLPNASTTRSVKVTAVPRELVAGRPTRANDLARIAAAQPNNRTIDFRLKPADVLAEVQKSLNELEKIVTKAGGAGCDALALPEDTLGLLKWEMANRAAL